VRARTLRLWLGDRLARFAFRSTQDAVIAFTDSVTSARSVLVIMPLDQGITPPGQPVLEYLERTYAQENVTLITHEADLALTRRLPRSTVIRMTASDITPVLLVRKEFLERVMVKPFDLALDLNLDFLLPSAYICKASKARVRVGFVRERSEGYYNFTVNANPSLRRDEVYGRLTRYLQMF
jgi:ADP-heptose:LPS heptosyltransferase